MMQASLPDCTVTPRIRSSTLTVELSGANMAELPDGAPPSRQACSLTLNWSSSLIWPAFSSRNTTASVMSLLMLAGDISVSASFS